MATVRITLQRQQLGFGFGWRTALGAQLSALIRHSQVWSAFEELPLVATDISPWLRVESVCLTVFDAVTVHVQSVTSGDEDANLRDTSYS